MIHQPADLLSPFAQHTLLKDQSGFQAALFYQKGETNKISGRLGSAGRAHVGAGTAVLALGSVNHIQAVHFGDCAFRAFGFACAALNAIISNHIRHGCFPFVRL